MSPLEALRAHVPRVVAVGASAGAVEALLDLLPLLPADVETLADYADKDHIGLDDRRDRLHVLAFPRGKNSARFNGGGRLLSAETKRGWKLWINADRRLRLDVEASLATLKRPFLPRAVRVDGRELAGNKWSYDRKSQAIRIEARVEDGKIAVSR